MSSSVNQVVVVDDESPNLESLERILKGETLSVHTFMDPVQALAFLRKNTVDVLITDLRMGSLSGLELLETVKIIDPTIEVVLITAFGTVQIAVEAMKKGAYDFITKPLQRIQVLKSVHQALERRRLVNENLSLKEELRTRTLPHCRDLVGKSAALLQVVTIANQAAKSRANVLIEGESGTGKGVLAEYIHRTSEASQGILVKINCTAIPENLLEAELFGFEPGAFTGATRRKKGRVELADGGTLFLDEIGIAPLTFQAKLLRFLQEGEFERLGSNETIKINTRVISATNADLKQAIKNGQLREDLYYRLNVIHLKVPPLRERREDIPLLVQKFFDEAAKKNGREVPLVRSEVLDCLAGHDWPGNVRELQNLVERMVVLNHSGVIELADLPTEVSRVEQETSFVIPFGLPLRQVEQLVMDETLRKTKGDKKLAARILGVHPRTIYRYLESRALPEVPPSEGTVPPAENSTI